MQYAGGSGQSQHLHVFMHSGNTAWHMFTICAQFVPTSVHAGGPGAGVGGVGAGGRSPQLNAPVATTKSRARDK